MTTEPEPTTPSPGYPVVLDVAGRQCLVVGGGPVAGRRAEGLLAAGARVTVVAPEVVPVIERMASDSTTNGVGSDATSDRGSGPRSGRGFGPGPGPGPGTGRPPGTLEIVRRRYNQGEAARYQLVVTATGDPVVDRAVVSDAATAGVPVNSADGDSPGSFQLPAVHRDGPVVVAVSTGGGSPALARWLRDRIAESLPPSAGILADLLGEARSAIRRSGRPTGSVDWEHAIAEVAVPLIESGRIDEARARLLALGGPTTDAGAAPGPLDRVSRMVPSSVLGLDEIDLSDLAFWERPWSEREGAFELLRRERPLAFFEEPDMSATSAMAPPPGPGYRAVTRHADVVEISRHPDVYCSGQGAVSIPDLPPEMVEYFAGMISTDNPRHARLRRIVSAGFNPRRIKAIEDSIEEVADRVIERASGLGECDFATEIATPFPLEIICDMMGIPASEYATVLRCSNVILSGGDPEYVPVGNDPVAAFIDAGLELTELMNELSAKRVADPADDLTTALITTNIDGEALTTGELASFFVLLLTAGNETTRNAITHGLLALTEHPDQRALWQADPDTVGATGVDEIVRWASPVIWMRRTVTEDTVLSGEELHPGDKVLLFYNSANRDQSVFEDPYRFDVRRSPNPHVGFGAAGPHFCLGAHLARREVDVMMRELLRRLPDIESTGEPDRLHSSFINGIKHLPCRFSRP